jgi:hypothetical protein
MRSFNWDAITESNDGGFTPLPAGPYVASIVDAIDHPDRENVEVVYDIAEGEFAGYYDDDFGKRNTWSHRLYLSYRTEGGLRMTKGRLKRIQESNPGFDPFAAWDAGRLDMFRNRLVGINLQEVEYENNSGEVKTKLEVCQVVSAQDVRDGKVKARQKKELENKPASSSDSSPTDDDFDIPFID